MNAKKILFATDFSEASQAALHYAEMMARDTKATLIILHVQEPIITYAMGDAPLALDTEQPEVNKMLEQVVPHDLTIPYEHRLEVGSPADEIVQAAEDEHADLIVIGTHGRTGLSRLLMGSVAETVVRRATCPVITLRQPQAKGH